MGKLTEAQRRVLHAIVETGFVEHKSGFGTSQSNRPAWRLVGLGFADFGFGPKHSFLQTQGFMPTAAGRSALAASTEGEPKP